MMDQATLEALEASIQHWKENEQVQSIEEAKIFAHSCALCKIFSCKSGKTDSGKWMEGCFGCPVAIAGQECEHLHSFWRACYKAHIARDLEAFLPAARAMREFLESLKNEQ
jgi:hypothetical protein